MIRRCACSPDCQREVSGRLRIHPLCARRRERQAAYRWGNRLRRVPVDEDGALIEARYQQALAAVKGRRWAA